MGHRIFVGITTKQDAAENVRKQLLQMREVTTACTISSGVYDVVAIVEIHTLERYSSFAIDTLSSIDGIKDYHSFIAVDSSE
jgi:DNA-binding Lrp family transcriptional regulator